MIKLQMTGKTDIGKVRQNNEDAFFIDKETGLMIVADGMGGQQAGEVASRIIVEALPAHLSKNISGRDLSVEDAKAELVNSIQAISKLTMEKGSLYPELKGMGSTIVAGFFIKNSLVLAHSGDSRAYLFSSGKLKSLTKDHNVAAMLYDAGVLDTKERRVHPGRFALAQYSGMSEELQPDLNVITVSKGDLILLCSDGLTEMLADDVIQETLVQSDSIKEACTKLVDLANEAGGRDNITVILSQVISLD